MSRYFLVRTEKSGWELWLSGQTPDELDIYLKICRENWIGNFEILPEFEIEAQREKILAKDYVKHFRWGLREIISSN